jgi:hypothetical protein
VFPKGKLAPEARALRVCGTEATPDPIAQRRYDDPDEAIIMDFLGRVFSDGVHRLASVGDGEIELKYRSAKLLVAG